MQVVCDSPNSISRRAAVKVAMGAAVTTLLATCAHKEEAPVAEGDVIGEEAGKPSVTVSDRRDTAPASEFARLLEEGKVSSIRLIGDSITAGFLCDGYGPTTDVLAYDGAYGTFYETAPEVDCWANRFRAFATDLGVGSFVNAGVNGAKMRWLAEDAHAWIRESADVIFVMLGTNDAVYHTADEYRSFAEAGLSAVAESCEHMVVMAPPDNAWTDYSKQMSQEEVERVLGEVCAAHGWEFISLYHAIQTGTDQFNEDQCHPSSKGSAMLWESIKQQLGL